MLFEIIIKMRHALKNKDFFFEHEKSFQLKYNLFQKMLFDEIDMFHTLKLELLLVLRIDKCILNIFCNKKAFIF